MLQASLNNILFAFFSTKTKTEPLYAVLSLNWWCLFRLTFFQTPNGYEWRILYGTHSHCTICFLCTTICSFSSLFCILFSHQSFDTDMCRWFVQAHHSSNWIGIRVISSKYCILYACSIERFFQFFFADWGFNGHQGGNLMSTSCMFSHHSVSPGTLWAGRHIWFFHTHHTPLTLEFYPRSKWTRIEIQFWIKLWKMPTVVSNSLLFLPHRRGFGCL